MFEIGRRVQIGNDPQLNRSPSQPFLRQRAGSRNVVTYQEPELSKVLAGLLRELEATDTFGLG